MFIYVSAQNKDTTNFISKQGNYAIFYRCCLDSMHGIQPLNGTCAQQYSTDFQAGVGFQREHVPIDIQRHS